MESKCCTVSLSLNCWPQSLLRQHSWLQPLPFVSQYFGIQSLPYECLVFSVLFAGTFGFSLCCTNVLYSLSCLPVPLDSVSAIRVLYSLSCLPVPLDSVSVIRVSSIFCLLCQYLWIQFLSYKCLVFSVFSASTFGFSLYHTYTNVLYSLSSSPVPLVSFSAIRIRVSCILCLLCQHLWIQCLPYGLSCILCLLCLNLWIQSLSCLPVPFPETDLCHTSVLFASTGFSLCHTSLVFSNFFASTFGFSLCHTSVVSASARFNDLLFEILGFVSDPLQSVLYHRLFFLSFFLLFFFFFFLFFFFFFF